MKDMQIIINGCKRNWEREYKVNWSAYNNKLFNTFLWTRMKLITNRQLNDGDSFLAFRQAFLLKDLFH